MSHSLNVDTIVSTVAHEAASRIAKKVIRNLQRMTDTLSGDDSGLKTTWDDICVQVQSEQSAFWNEYDETVRLIVGGYVDELPKHEREAIWLQTSSGDDWIFTEPEEREAYPVIDQEVTDFLVKEYVYTEAGRWTNSRIRKYLGL